MKYFIGCIKSWLCHWLKVTINDLFFVHGGVYVYLYIQCLAWNGNKVENQRAEKRAKTTTTPPGLLCLDICQRQRGTHSFCSSWTFLICLACPQPHLTHTHTHILISTVFVLLASKSCHDSVNITRIKRSKKKRHFKTWNTLSMTVKIMKTNTLCLCSPFPLLHSQFSHLTSRNKTNIVELLHEKLLAVRAPPTPSGDYSRSQSFQLQDFRAEMYPLGPNQRKQLPEKRKR